MLLELFIDLAAHAVVGRAALAVDLETNRGTRDVFGSEVGGHDDDGVLEVDNATLAVGQATLFENLQQRVEDVGMCLLNLVEEHDAERLATNLLGELAALFESDESGGCTEQTRDGVLLAVLAHVERDESTLVVEQELGESLGELGLSDTRGAGEDERARRALGVFEASTRASNGLGESLDGLVLPDNALVQGLLHEDQASRLFFGELEYRDARGLSQDLGDDSLIDDTVRGEVARTPLLFFANALALEGLLFIAQFGSELEVLVFDCLFFLGASQSNLVVELTQLGRVRQERQAQTSTGLIDQVDGLVGQETVADVAVGKVCGGNKSTVGDLNLVVRFVAVTQTLENVDGVRQRGLGNLNRLEAALECGILFKVLAVLIEGGCTNGLELASGKHWLEDARGIDCTFSGTCTDQSVNLVDENDDVAASADLFGDLLEALFEVTAVTAAGDERAEVKRVYLLVFERLGNLTSHDGLG